MNDKLQLERSPSQEQERTLTPEEVNAMKWLETTQAYLDIRVDDFRTAGNEQAAQALEDLQQPTLDMLNAGVAAGNPQFIAYVSSLEEGASNGRPDSPSYAIIHGQQLDHLALGVVEKAQQKHDENLT
jgi:hypothetical protein